MRRVKQESVLFGQQVGSRQDHTAPLPGPIGSPTTRVRHVRTAEVTSLHEFQAQMALRSFTPLLQCLGAFTWANTDHIFPPTGLKSPLIMLPTCPVAWVEQRPGGSESGRVSETGAKRRTKATRKDWRLPKEQRLEGSKTAGLFG